MTAIKRQADDDGDNHYDDHDQYHDDDDHHQHYPDHTSVPKAVQRT